MDNIVIDPKPTNGETLYTWLRQAIKKHTEEDNERIQSRMLRRILWERAKGELISMTYTYNLESESKTRTLHSIMDFVTVIENYLTEEQGGIYNDE